MEGAKANLVAAFPEGAWGDAQSLRQSSLRCGTRFVGTAEGLSARKSSKRKA